MIKALFFDLDGTLLTSDKKISKASLNILSKCKEKGISIFVVTARAPMLDIMLGFDEKVYSLLDGGIYCNGACIKYKDKAMYSLIDPIVVNRCTQIISKYSDVHIALHLEGDEHAFNHMLPDTMLVPWGLKRDEVFFIEPMYYTKSMKLLIYYENMVDSTNVLPDDLYSEIEEICKERANVFLLDHGKTIQVINNDVNKYTAVEYIRESLGLSKEEIAVFGDGENDIDMLSQYPNSIAMGNACESVKKISSYITKTNDEEGIEFAIRDIIRII